jgi:hypothetical protein
MGLAFAAAFVLIGALVLWFVQRSGGRTNVAEKAGLEAPADPSQQKVSNPAQKFIEVVGIRLVTENKKSVAKFVVVNHSSADVSNLEANVTLRASTARSDEDAIGTFSFKLASLGPNASQETTAPLKTKLKPYEMPDWQNATADVQVTSPQP